MSTIERKMTVCDDCLTYAYDKRIGVVNEWDYEDLDEFDEAEKKGLVEQQVFMVTTDKYLLETHRCSLTEDPEAYPKYGIMCDCAYNPKRFEHQREWVKKQRVKEGE